MSTEDIFLPEPPPGAPVVVFLIEQEGCGHCEDYHPIFVEVAKRYAAYGVPVVRVDAATDDQITQTWMARHRVEGTPTVIAATNWRGPVGKLDGVPGDPREAAAATARLFDRALMFNRPGSTVWGW